MKLYSRDDDMDTGRNGNWGSACPFNVWTGTELGTGVTIYDFWGFTHGMEFGPRDDAVYLP